MKNCFKYFFLSFITFQSIFCFGQIGYLKEFYPSNTIFEKLKVKSVLDSFVIQPENSRIILYDSMGKEIDSYYSSCNECAISPTTIYNKEGDTLFKVKLGYDTSLGKVFSFEKFTYSKNGKIKFYTLCHKSYSLGKEVYARINEFYYDDKDSLTAMIEYTNHDYHNPVKNRMNVLKSELNMSNVIYYSYQKTPKYNVVIAKQAFGKIEWRQTDSFYYDKRNRLFRKSSFSEVGTNGEMRLSDLHRITTYSWNDTVLTSLDYYTYCFAKSKEIGCLTTLTSEIDKHEFVYNKKGLLQLEYGYYSSGEKHLISSYYYSFYD